MRIIVDLDEELASRLDAVAPARSRRRSEFVREALRRALWLRDEERTARAYRAQADSGESVFDAAVWDDWDEPEGS